MARCSPPVRTALHAHQLSSWLNLVEPWFAGLTNKKLRRGAHRSVRELNDDVRAWIETCNDNPKPFVWTMTADQILDSIAPLLRTNQRLTTLEPIPIDLPSVPDSSPEALQVGLVHDFLLDVRGAERVFLQLCEMWPDAPIFTAVYDEDGTEGRFAGRTIHTSLLQRLRPSARTFRALFPFYPAAIESFDLSGYDLVVSSSSAWAHGVICNAHTVHVSYCHNPFRYAWNDREPTLSRRRNPVTRAFLQGAFRRWRHWDRRSAERTNSYVANSRITQARIRAYYRREAAVVSPPVETRRFSPGRVGDHYALVSELMPHKQIDVAIEAFNKLRLPLIVVGDGPAGRKLRRIAGPTVQFAGRVPDAEVARILQGARALIVTAVEEFGIAAVESQAAGRPVIARGEGGALETVIDGVTGCFWSGGPDELAQAVLQFDDGAVDPKDCVGNARTFDVASFRKGIRAAIQAAQASAGPKILIERQPLPSTRLVRMAARAHR
jgi:glycosyltransferase involved in cell wall biosynthesis